MTRSRAFNRFNRLNAKRRRHTLRSEVPGLQYHYEVVAKKIDYSQELLKKVSESEVLAELMDTTI